MIHRHGKDIAFNRHIVKHQITRKRAVQMLDDIFSRYIRARDENKCYCHRIIPGEPIQCCHLISRSSYSVRWTEENCSAGHRSCNFEHEYHPEKMTSWWIKKHGMMKYDALILRSHLPVKYSTAELLTLAKFYERKLKELKQIDKGGRT